MHFAIFGDPHYAFKLIHVEMNVGVEWMEKQGNDIL